MSYDEVRTAALTLPEDDRIELHRELGDSFVDDDHDDIPYPPNPRSSEETEKIVAERPRQIDAGEVELMSHEEVMREARRRLGR
jgi:hypothetical protein